MYITLAPAYSRDYKSKKEVLEAWLAQKDFRIESIGHPACGGYINAQQAPTSDVYNIRFKQLRNVAILSFKNGKWKVS